MPYQGAASGDRVTLGIRPEHLSLDQGGDLALQGTVESVERLGDITYLYLSGEGDELITVAQQGDHEMPTDKTVTVYADSKRAHVFGADGKVLPK